MSQGEHYVMFEKYDNAAAKFFIATATLNSSSKAQSSHRNLQIIIMVFILMKRFYFLLS